jgi:hypothetical protein
MKRDKGNFFKENDELNKKLEEELDHIVRSINDLDKKKSDEILLLNKNIETIIQGSKTSGGSIISGGLGNAARLSALPYSEQMIAGSNLYVVKKDFTTASLDLTSLVGSDIVESITVLVKTTDSGVTEFKVNDGTNDLLILGDVDFSMTSVQTPARSCWIEYTSPATLSLYILGATTLTGKIIIKLLRNPGILQ